MVAGGDVEEGVEGRRPGANEAGEEQHRGQARGVAGYEPAWGRCISLGRKRRGAEPQMVSALVLGLVL